MSVSEWLKSLNPELTKYDDKYGDEQFDIFMSSITDIISQNHEV